MTDSANSPAETQDHAGAKPDLTPAFELWKMLESQVHLANHKANLLTVANAGQMALFGVLFTPHAVPNAVALTGLALAAFALVYSVWISAPFKMIESLGGLGNWRQAAGPTPFFFNDIKAPDGQLHPVLVDFRHDVLTNNVEQILEKLLIDISAKATWARRCFALVSRAVFATILPSVVSGLLWLGIAMFDHCAAAHSSDPAPAPHAAAALTGS